MPTYLERVDAIPLTSHGKLDVEALPWVDPGHLSEAEFREPEGPVEEALVAIWRDELGLERVGGGDNFFELGGTSLTVMEVMIRLCREFDIDLPLETLFDHPVLGDLARVAEDRILADAEALEEAEG